MGMTPSERPYLAEYVVTDAEAAAAGITPETPHLNSWGDLIAPILERKGCPKEELFLGNGRLVTHRREADKVFFRLYHKPAPVPRND